MNPPSMLFSRDAQRSAGCRAPLRVAAKQTLAVICTIVLVVYLLFFHRLADRDLWSSHEARAAMDAQTILDDGIWGLPRLYDGRLELQKPPLYYWLVASLAWLRGGTVDAWAVRLPAAGAATLCVLLAGIGLGIGRKRPAAGLMAAAALATALHFTWLARIGRIDMPLTLSVTLALGGLYLARGRPRRTRWPLLITAYLALAAGVLLKGPIGVVLPAATMCTYLLLELGPPTPRRWRSWTAALGELGVWWGVPVVAVLTLPWFVWANRATDGELFRVFIWHHNIERGWGGSQLRSNPWWFYVPMFLGDFLPWSLLLPPAVWWSYRRGLWRTDADARFGLIWFSSVLLVLSCSRFKRADYLLPAYPGAAVFLGCAGQQWLREMDPRRRQIAIAGLAALAASMVAGWLVWVEWHLAAREPYRDYRAFAGRVRQLAPRPEQVILFRTEAHPLAFRLGRPLSIVVQWGELNSRLMQPGTHYFVTPPQYAEESFFYLQGLRLERVLGNWDLSGGEHERPLVLLRARLATVRRSVTRSSDASAKRR
ncbi:MAG TPA: phospholipid carrier-dependent glycosyltransferase [Gemmataceae bacterium]|nr:phospholipid carrier-dependent glycosyltransferase [Gemmataceae bacterium]